MKLQHIDPALILCDAEFNSRGKFTVHDVADLIDGIKQHGLLQPIVVRAWNADGFEWKLVAGHRRYIAWGVACDGPIPCVIQDDESPVDETQARVLNLIENMQRKDINILQEAKAIEHLVNAKLNTREIGKLLGVSSGWVQTRMNVLALPEDVQREVALGMLTTRQIQQLYATRSYPDSMRQLLKAMKDGRKSGRTVTIRSHKSMQARVKRDSNDVIRMIEHLAQAGFGFHTRCLAWAAGTISSFELMQDFREYCDEHGLTYPYPPDRL